MDLIGTLVRRARAGDLEAFGLLVGATQTMAHGVASSVLRDPDLARDAVQDAYVRAFRRLGDLEDPALFSSWLRRIVVTVAINLRRSRRRTFLHLDEFDVPVLDETETRWSDAQRERLAAALLTLTPDERRLCGPAIPRPVEHCASRLRRGRRRGDHAKAAAAHPRQVEEGDRSD